MIRLACLLLFASTAFADVTIEVDKKVVPVNSFATLTVKASPTVLWKVFPKPVKVFTSGNVIHVAGVPGGTYSVYADVVDFEKKTFDGGVIDITFDGASPVVPDPVKPVDPVKPPVPVPVDAFTTKILAAYAKETAPNKAALAAAFAQVYRTKSTEAATTNAARFIDFMLLLEAARSAADGGALSEIRTAISVELNTLLPTTVTTALDAAGKSLLSTQMARVAVALEACK